VPNKLFSVATINRTKCCLTVVIVVALVLIFTLTFCLFKVHDREVFIFVIIGLIVDIIVFVCSIGCVLLNSDDDPVNSNEAPTELSRLETFV
jgi:hypothetical protein